jgi:general stress protein YciG
MPGTIEGGRKAAATNKAKYGDGFYSSIGRKGGKRSSTGGFASLKVGKDGLTGAERAKLAGAKGGKLSKRGPAKRGGKVINADYTKGQLDRIRNELGWSENQVIAALDEVDKKVKLLNIELERLRHETTQ